MDFLGRIIKHRKMGKNQLLQNEKRGVLLFWGYKSWMFSSLKTLLMDIEVVDSVIDRN